jgi:folylpolyglutamate synthase/dihydropteroate synthase
VRPEVLRELVDHPRLRAVPRLAEALDIVRQEAAPEDAVFISGSLFLAGEARSLLVG